MDEQSGEEFRAFMHARWPAMVRLAYGLTGDRGHAEDVAQSAFARACAAWSRVRRAGDPDAYVRQIVINENRRRFRGGRAPGLPHWSVTVYQGPWGRCAIERGPIGAAARCYGFAQPAAAGSLAGVQGACR